MKKRVVSFIGMMVLLCGCVSTGSGESGSPALSGNVEGEITVSCYDTMTYKAFLDDAAARFEQKYPGTKVNIETVSAMPEIKTKEEDGRMMAVITKGEDDPAALNDYISKVSTELMSGGGADVIAIDVVPHMRYAQNGQLVDLNKFMEQDNEWSGDGYLQNIFNAVQYNGGQYIMPLNYTFDYLCYDTSLQGAPPENTNTLAKLIESGNDEFMRINSDSVEHTYMFGYSDYTEMGASMFYELLDERYAEFIDVPAKKVNLNDGEFAELLESVKKLSDDGLIKRGEALSSERMARPEELERMREEKYMYNQKTSEMMFMDFNKSSNTRMFIVGAGGSSEDDEIIGISANSDGSVPLTLGQAFGINANTKNPDTAWAFIKFLLSNEMQGSMMLGGLPVSNAARHEKAESKMKGQIGGAALAIGGNAGGGKPRQPDAGEESELNQVQAEELEQYRAAVENFSAEINTYTVRDRTIDEMVTSEVKYFFSGERSAKGVADALQSKVELYLKE